MTGASTASMTGTPRPVSSWPASPGLASTLMSADATWGARIADANSELDRMAPQSALTATAQAIAAIKQEDPTAIPDAIAASPASHWAPDVPAMTAASIAGMMTEGTRLGLEGAAQDAADKGVLKWVENWGTSADGKWSTGFSKLGIVGNAIGTVPAIANDINGGMDPTKAIVSESAGTAAGLAVGTWAGSAAAGALAGSGARGRNSRRFRRGRCCRRGNRLRSLQERAMDMVVTETNPPPPV